MTDRRIAEIAGGDGQCTFCRKIREEQQRGTALTTARLTALECVSGATYYRFDPETVPAVRDVEVRDAIQRIALKHPAYVRLLITAEDVIRGRRNLLPQYQIHGVAAEPRAIAQS